MRARAGSRAGCEDRRAACRCRRSGTRPLLHSGTWAEEPPPQRFAGLDATQWLPGSPALERAPGPARTKGIFLRRGSSSGRVLNLGTGESKNVSRAADRFNVVLDIVAQLLAHLADMHVDAAVD